MSHLNTKVRRYLREGFSHQTVQQSPDRSSGSQTSPPSEDSELVEVVPETGAQSEEVTQEQS